MRRLMERIMRFFGVETSSPPVRTDYPDVSRENDLIASALNYAGARQKAMAEISQKQALDMIDQSEEIKHTLGGLMQRMERERHQ